MDNRFHSNSTQNGSVFYRSVNRLQFLIVINRTLIVKLSAPHTAYLV